MPTKEINAPQPLTENIYVAQALGCGTFGSLTGFARHSNGISESPAVKERRENDVDEPPNDLPGYLGRAVRAGRFAAHSNWPNYMASPV